MTGNEPEQSGPPAPCDPVRGRRRQQDEPELEGAAGQAARHAAAERKPLDPATRVTRPARGAVFPKIALTRHRAFRDGYPLIKVFESSADEEHRYSPPQVTEAIAKPMWGNPAPERICTSHVERQNLSIRMAMCRMTRLTNGFSKKWENLKAAYALWFAFYNFCRVHQTLRVTPATEAGITGHVWTPEEMLASLN
jgi:hypothetical protein